LETESIFAPAAHLRYALAQLIGRPLVKSVDPHCWQSWEDSRIGSRSIDARQPTVPVDGRVGGRLWLKDALNRKASSESIDQRGG
jgi:hypothetical protein